MEYTIGDLVRIRSWKDLCNEYSSMIGAGAATVLFINGSIIDYSKIGRLCGRMYYVSYYEMRSRLVDTFRFDAFELSNEVHVALKPLTLNYKRNYLLDAFLDIEKDETVWLDSKLLEAIAIRLEKDVN